MKLAGVTLDVLEISVSWKLGEIAVRVLNGIKWHIGMVYI